MEYLFRQKDHFDDSTVFVRFSEDEMYEIVSKFRGFLLAAGFSSSVVDVYVPDPIEHGIVVDEEFPHFKEELAE